MTSAHEAPTNKDVRISKDDEQAMRLVNLLVGFSNAHHPLTSAEVKANWYAVGEKCKISDDSFSKAFSRDRKQLARLGVIIEQAGSRDSLKLWQLNGTESFVDHSQELSEIESMQLVVALSPLRDDPAFPFRSELSRALSKINTSFSIAPQGVSVGREEARNPIENHLSDALLSQHFVRADYQKADGKRARYRLALLGTFGNWYHSYYVAAKVDEKGEFDVDAARVFRLDRFARVSVEERSHYEIPLDFNAESYHVLPFQIGEPTESLTFLVAPTPSDEVQNACVRSGSVQRDESGSMRWAVSAADVSLAARWAVAEGITPLSPRTLVDAYNTIVKEAADTHAKANVVSRLQGSGGKQSQSVTKRSKGRPGGIERARDLFALIGALQNDADSLSVEAVAKRLNCSTDHARRLTDLLIQSTAEGEGTHLPLTYDEATGEVGLSSSTPSRAHGRPVRLLPSEAYALLKGMAATGISLGGPHGRKLVRALAERVAEGTRLRAFPSVSPTPRTETPAQSNNDGKKILTCSQALNAQKNVRFDYQSAGFKSSRTVRPLGLVYQEGHSYLSAYDLGRQSERLFRTDRMSNVSATDSSQASDWLPESSEPRPIVFEVLDRKTVMSFNWPNTHFFTADGRTMGQTDYYGGMWLVRRFAALSRAVALGDEGLCLSVGDYARELLHMPM
ncbi:helix-turn-helix transcriptional regulator [Parafannyhessea umbonata]|uniref:Predicted DNA-binding transcriptional regulator YafY, contains an HTH and WYL domains n=1 Tax=Parafannyhessea umbonata TaxID=604330 RepID=A0A1H9Q0I9_9ACTN|nr:WYL domain-containing protein [Parafannyhessea umbonata]SER53489.1 Predicted DNA-binding transcriptional regulator YafY, contains an HTH and WYL domains [Parafannyhessea umbonata]